MTSYQLQAWGLTLLIRGYFGAGSSVFSLDRVIKIGIVHRERMEIRLAPVLIIGATCEVIVYNIMMSGVCARSFPLVSQLFHGWEVRKRNSKSSDIDRKASLEPNSSEPPDRFLTAWQQSPQLLHTKWIPPSRVRRSRGVGHDYLLWSGFTTVLCVLGVTAAGPGCTWSSICLGILTHAGKNCSFTVSESTFNGLPFAP